ncbi:alkaline phosphatase family protein [Stella sp.]|uniref:alkaline phosphatase family protein n=1 Tax=Stella sp. TaxID=2912054 RepID=UPI0035B428D4
MAAVRNILFVMCDQLRADHLGVAGHPHLETPNLDALARRGVRFERAYVQSGVCGPSRMSFYTGRYMFSHGATWNRVPLSVRERTIGDHLRPSGMRVALAGKTHVLPDADGLQRYGIEAGSALDALLREGGFESLDRYDGHSRPGRESGYPAFLAAHGYGGDDPWNDWVISAEAPDGRIVSGWQMRNARLAARVAEEHSETAYMTDQAIRFVAEQGERPWFLHLSYVKPHWPYMAPAPYHAMYGPEDCLPLNRAASEFVEPHPVIAAYRGHEESRNFAREEVARTVRPTYMGLVSQIDAHVGRLLAALRAAGRLEDTLIVFTADHGDFLGDHWLGEKEIFHEEAVRVPLLVVDPDPRADATRGRVERRLVEAIDLLPTFLDVLGLDPATHLVEGRSLTPLLRGPSPATWREAAVSELDYSFRQARITLGREPGQCRAWMVRTERWKYVDWLGFRPQLFDLAEDPQERVDLGTSGAHRGVRAEMRDRLWEWVRERKLRTTLADAEVRRRTARHKEHGIFFGVW